MASLSERPANYLSQRSADVVLSEIRPTKLAPDALRSINVFLDELLWMILNAARSFSTDRLKAAFGKIITTSLGKEALLEAEMELKSYMDRTVSSDSPSQPYAENAQDFPLQAAFELLRLKCEAYSTLNDSDEDMDAESRWQNKVKNYAGFPSHNEHYIAASALYVTAIIEFTCEHILSSIARVVSRDSSRTTANLQDLYVALCEDDAIYGTFKGMKVFVQIKAQSIALSSDHRGPGKHSRDPSNHSRLQSTSLSSSATTPSSENEMNLGAAAKPRQSSESSGSGTAMATAPSSSSRSSTEKSRAKKLFGRTSVDKEASQSGHGIADGSGHKRSESLISNGRRSVTPYDDGPNSSPSATELEFDELMRSGTTMKVSLTPDRLRTFELYNKERGQRRQGLTTATNLPISTKPELEVDSVSGVEGADSVIVNKGMGVSGRPSQLRSVDSILEDEENNVVVAAVPEKNGVRPRKDSKTPHRVSVEIPAPPLAPSARSRSKSASASSASAAYTGRGVGRKSSLNALAPALPSLPKALRDDGMPPVRKRSHAGRKDSIDAILDGSSDEDEMSAAQLFTPKAARGNGSTTHDLVAFLNDGPPEYAHSLAASTSSTTTEGRAKQGRFRSMVSRLTRGGSNEKLTTGHASVSEMTSPRKKSISSNHPPPAFIPPPLSAKKSLHSISSYSQTQTHPVSPLDKDKVSQAYPAPLSLPSSFGKGLMEPSPSTPSRLRASPTSTRKAVPSFDGSLRSAVESSNSIQDLTSRASQSPKEEVIGDRPSPTLKEVAGSSPLFTRTANSPSVTELRTSPSTTKPPQVVTPKESPRSSPTHTRPANIIIKQIVDDSDTSNVPAALRPKRTSSIDRGSPSPTIQRLHPSRATQRHALTPPATPSSAVFASHAKDMRRLMANATNADECRLLVDMFLAQSGFPVKATEIHPDPTKEPSEQQHAEVVEVLLGHDDVFTTPRTEFIDISHTTPESSLPTPRSASHSPSSTISRKALPSPDLRSLATPSPVVLAEA